jgi:hypothetical protein
MMFLVLAFMVAAAGAVAQDIIVKTDGSEIEAKVTDIGLTEIKYKKFSNPDGPVYVMPKNEVFMIKYENGEKDVFGLQEATAENIEVQPKKEEITTPQSKRNVEIPANDDLVTENVQLMVMLRDMKIRVTYPRITIYKKGDIVWFDKTTAQWYIEHKYMEVYTPKSENERVIPVNNRVLVEFLKQSKNKLNKQKIYQKGERVWLGDQIADWFNIDEAVRVIQTDVINFAEDLTGTKVEDNMILTKVRKAVLFGTVQYKKGMLLWLRPQKADDLIKRKFVQLYVPKNENELILTNNSKILVQFIRRGVMDIYDGNKLVEPGKIAWYDSVDAYFCVKGGNARILSTDSQGYIVKYYDITELIPENAWDF